MSSSAPPPVPDRIGRYKIERKIGEGGMGVVYAARDERLDRTVVLKAIRGETDDTSRKRLWREARAAAGISHPNISVQPERAGDRSGNAKPRRPAWAR